MSKSDQLVEALGAIDELNSWIGLSRHKTNLDDELKRIQNNLLTIGSGLAGSGKKIGSGETKRLEKLIDKMTDEMPKLSHFVYPKGELQVARAVCRRAERRVVACVNTKSEILKTKQIQNILKYLNRLSDALFTMGRWVNYKAGISEEIW